MICYLFTVSQNLPIHVSASTLEDHPKLGSLLEDLTDRLTPSAVHTATQTDLNNASASLQQARSSKYYANDSINLYRNDNRQIFSIPG